MWSSVTPLFQQLTSQINSAHSQLSQIKSSGKVKRQTQQDVANTTANIVKVCLPIDMCSRLPC